MVRDDALETAEGRRQRLRHLLGAHDHRAHRDRARRRRRRAAATRSSPSRSSTASQGRIPVMAQARLAVIAARPGRAPGGRRRLIDALPPSWAAPTRRRSRAPSSPTGGSTRPSRSSSALEPRRSASTCRWATALAERARAAMLLARGDARTRPRSSRWPRRRRARGRSRDARSQVLAGRALALAGERAEAIASCARPSAPSTPTASTTTATCARRELRKLNARTEPRGPSARGRERARVALDPRARDRRPRHATATPTARSRPTLFLSEKTVEIAPAQHLRQARRVLARRRRPHRRARRLRERP